MPDPDYRVVVEVGAHSYDVTYGDAPDYGVTLPLTVGWDTPEATEFYPCQANPTSGSFGLCAATVGDLDDLALGDLVSIAVYVPSTAVDPWQTCGGVVTQLDAQVAPQPGGVARVQVYFTDPTWLLGRKVVGLVDYPLELVDDRIDRICAEAGVTRADIGILNEGRLGILAARDASPTDMLSLLQATLRDNASRNVSYDPDLPVYSRDVFTYDPTTNTLYLTSFERRPYSWPAELGVDGTLHRRVGEPNALDGCAVTTSGRWTRLPGDQVTYVIVDGVTFPLGIVPPAGAVPYVRSTSYVDDFSLPGGNTSSTARVFLGRSLVPDDSSEPVADWRTDTIRHLSYLDPEPVAGWIDNDLYVGGVFGLGWARIRPTLVEPIDPSLTLDGRTWIAGLLTGARLTIPPGGRFYIDATLRPQLLEPFVPLSAGAATYDDVPPALTYDDLDPLLTYRDLNMAGA